MAKKKASSKDELKPINIFHPPATTSQRKEKKTDGNNQQAKSAGKAKAEKESGEGKRGESGATPDDSGDPGSSKKDVV